MPNRATKLGNLLMWIPAIALGLSVVRSSDETAARLTLLALPILLFASIVIFYPIKLHRTHSVALEPTYVPYDPGSPSAPAEVRAQFARTSWELELLGFAPELHRQSPRTVPNATGYVSLYRNRRTLETVKLVTAIATVGAVRNATSLAVCATEFADGTEVVTSNRASPRYLPSRPPPYYAVAVPQVQDIGELLNVHRAFVGRYEAGRLRVAAYPNDPAAYLWHRDHLPFLTHSVATGYAYHDEANGVQRPTWKGAILMTWKLTPPVKQVRLALDRLAARRFLATLATA